MASERETRPQLAGRWLLALLVPASALAMGTLHTLTLVIVAALAAMSCSLLWLGAPRRSTPALAWTIGAFGLLFAVTALQVLPLPAGLVAVVAPTNADVWARALGPFHEVGPTWHPITIAPAATREQLLRAMLYSCVLLAAARVSLSAGGGRFLSWVIVASACGLALVTLLHSATGAERVFGVYRPRDLQGFSAGRIGPLLNPNHLSAYENIGACVAAAIALEDRRLAPRVLATAGALLLTGVSVWAGSRGGTGGLLASALLLAGLVAFKRRRRLASRRGALEAVLVFGALLAGGVFFGIGASEVARSDLASNDVSKLELVRSAFRLVSTSPLCGIGRGGFETMFPVVSGGARYVRFIAPENILAQWTIEWGVPFALAAFALFAIALRPRVVLAAETPAFGPWVALVGTVLHELVDFHLEVPAIAMVASVCVAIVVTRRPADGNTRNKAFGPSRVARTIAMAAVPACVLVTMIAWPSIGHSLSDERDAVAAAVLSPEASDERVRSELHDAMLRYPAEPFFPLAGAIHAQASGRESVVPWISRALERYPHFGRAHLVLARSLAGRHRAQARLEYRLAYVYDVKLRGPIAREAPALVEDASSAFELVPDGDAGLEMLETLASSIQDRLPSTSAQVDAELLRRNATARGALLRNARRTLSDLVHRHPWCALGDHCAHEAVSAAEELVRLEQDKCEPRVVVARARIAAGDVGPALDDLADSLDRLSERGECIRALVGLSLEVGDRRRSDSALERATRAGCGTRAQCVDLYVWAATTEEARGNTVRAIAFRKRAADLEPEKDDHLVTIAQLSEKVGLIAEALDAYGKLAQRHPEEPRWRSRIAEVKASSDDRRRAVPH